MILIPVEQHQDATRILYELLLEREGASSVNISHQELPSYEKHAAFVASHPYGAWYLIDVIDNIVGAVYLTKPPRPSVAGNEFGIFIFERHRRNGYAREAIRMVMARHGEGPYFANINPRNEVSLALFHSLGFDTCQVTLKKQ